MKCPTGFFCFNKYSFIYIALILIVLIVYRVNLYNDKNNEKNSDLIKENSKFIHTVNNILNNIKLENQIKQDVIKKEIEIKKKKSYDTVYDPLSPPERQHTTNKIAINIPTRGEVKNYQQVGILIEEGSNERILPLYGKPTYPGSRQWLYYTNTEDRNMIKLPIVYKNKQCQGDYGCDEIYDNEKIYIEALKKNFNTNLYKFDKPRYIPYI